MLIHFVKEELRVIIWEKIKKKLLCFQLEKKISTVMDMNYKVNKLPM